MSKVFVFLSVATAVFALALPLLLSEIVTGWTKKFTSPVFFTPLKSIPNMTDKVAIVTGSNTGIGYVTAMELARAGANVIVAARSEERGTDAVRRIQKETDSNKVQFLQLDLASLDSVNKFAKSFQTLGLDLHTLVLNAGVMKSPGSLFIGEEMTYGFETTQDGFEYHIGVNHIGHAYLTQLLLENLKSTASKSPDGTRIVSVSSMAEQNAPESGIVFDQWVPENGTMPATYEDGTAYGQSKLANLMYAQKLSSHLNGTKVKVYACHPGVIASELTRYMEPVLEKSLSQKGFMERALTTVFTLLFKAAMFDVEGGALTQLHLATADDTTLSKGGFYHPVGRLMDPMHPQGSNNTLADFLWRETNMAIEKTIKA